MRTVLIVQARMASTRLPGKVLLTVGGKPMLAQQLCRLHACREVDEIAVATTRNAVDDAIVALARTEGVRCIRGDEHDVLGRYALAARECRADVVIRVTADCPLIDAAESDRVVRALIDNVSDYASNVVERTLPRGLDTEAFHRDVLVRMDRVARTAAAREHVTHFLLREHPELFLITSVRDREDYSHLRWTVDTAEDLAAVREIYAAFEGCASLPTYRDILQLVLSRPAITSLNAQVSQKAP